MQNAASHSTKARRTQLYLLVLNYTIDPGDLARPSLSLALAMASAVHRLPSRHVPPRSAAPSSLLHPMSHAVLPLNLTAGVIGGRVDLCTLFITRNAAQSTPFDAS